MKKWTRLKAYCTLYMPTKCALRHYIRKLNFWAHYYYILLLLSEIDHRFACHWQSVAREYCRDVLIIEQERIRIWTTSKHLLLLVLFIILAWGWLLDNACKKNRMQYAAFDSAAVSLDWYTFCEHCKSPTRVVSIMLYSIIQINWEFQKWHEASSKVHAGSK